MSPSSVQDFAGRTVLVTGAAGNLGRAVARVFGERGARLVLLDRRREDLERAFGTSGQGAAGSSAVASDAAAADGATERLLLAVDLLDAADVEAVVAQAAERCGGRLDVLANLAGGFRMGDPVHATPAATFDFLFELNLRTLLNASRAVVPRMLAAGAGCVVNVGAFSAQRGQARVGAYTAAKAGVQRLTEAMSAELRERGVRVNCVLPTTLDTPENRAAMPGADPARWLAPGALAEVIAFLASDAARAVHGASIPVTGLD